MRALLRAGLVLLAVLLAAGAGVAWRAGLFEGAPDDRPAATDAAAAARGEYLALAGNCAGCHTARGGTPFAGGRPIATPFGTVHSANLTPHATGLAGWRAGDFWRALHQGRSADGRLLVPACPFPNFTHLTRADSDDLFAHLQRLPPVAQPNRPHALRFPYGTQPALAVWRALSFRPGVPPQEAGRSAAWHRGAYLVAGLGHCGACHGHRNAWGATDGALDLGGGALPMQGWVAPALDDPAAAGVQRWTEAEVVALLRDGRNAHAGVAGPMAMVVARSTQHLRDDDLAAIATFLRALPERPVPRPPAAAAPPEVLADGERLYERHCAGCHGAQGEGAGAIAPALAGNRALALESPVNLMRVVLGGGFGPVTAGQPRPFGMPPFATTLSDAEIAAVVSFVRQRWGQGAAPVTATDVNRQRGG